MNKSNLKGRVAESKKTKIIRRCPETGVNSHVLRGLSENALGVRESLSRCRYSEDRFVAGALSTIFDKMFNAAGTGSRSILFRFLEELPDAGYITPTRAGEIVIYLKKNMYGAVYDAKAKTLSVSWDKIPQ